MSYLECPRVHKCRGSCPKEGWRGVISQKTRLLVSFSLMRLVAGCLLNPPDQPSCRTFNAEINARRQARYPVPMRWQQRRKQPLLHETCHAALSKRYTSPSVVSQSLSLFRSHLTWIPLSHKHPHVGDAMTRLVHGCVRHGAGCYAGESIA